MDPRVDASGGQPPTWRSAVDGWVAGATALGLGGAAYAIVAALRVDVRSGLVSLGILVAILALVGALSIPCRYRLLADHLLIQSGLVRYRIPYAAITGVAPSSLPWSAPALSLRRVRIDFDGRFALVSPVRREEFIAALEARLPPRSG